MEAIISTNGNSVVETEKSENLIEIAEGLLLDTNTDISQKETISVPVAELSALGGGVSALLPQLNTITQTTSINNHGLFRLANAAPGDVLKKAKNGNSWGALLGADGKSKMAQFAEAGPLSATTTTVVPPNPATMLMVVALYSIEQQLAEVVEMQKQVLRHVEFEKESEVEGDVEQLLSIITKYKYNWDNDLFLASNHKMVNDLQRTARANMNFYQKEVNSILESKQWFVANKTVNSTLASLLKKFRHYRLSLYTFGLSSMLEIMLSGNFKDEYILGVRDEIERMADSYRDTFGKCSGYLERMSGASIGNNVLKGVGGISQIAGRAIGAIPLVKNGSVDEFLIDRGAKIKENVEGAEFEIVKSFAEISNPGTGLFTAKMSEMSRIYNHTSEICFDKERIYLVSCA